MWQQSSSTWQGDASDGRETSERHTETLDALAKAVSRLASIWLTHPVDGLPGDGPQDVECSRIKVAQAVDATQGRPGEPATLAEVATRLMLDPARASRMVADTLHAGYIRRIVNATDGSKLVLTPTGSERLRAIRHTQRVGLLYLTHDWSDEERDQLAGLLTRFVAAADRQIKT